MAQYAEESCHKVVGTLQHLRVTPPELMTHGGLACVHLQGCIKPIWHPVRITNYLLVWKLNAIGIHIDVR